MIRQIGIVAGEIWDYLDNHGKSASMDDIIGDVQKERDLVLMSVGWLAREGHTTLEGKAPNYKLKLTNEKEQ